MTTTMLKMMKNMEKMEKMKKMLIIINKLLAALINVHGVVIHQDYIYFATD